MSYIKIIIPIFLLVLSLAACKKEYPEPSIKPDGFWRGNASTHHIGILNSPNGTSRLYFRIYGLDTAGATIGTGTYSLNGNSFKAQYIMNVGNSMFVQHGSVSENQITGQLFSSTSPDIVDFNIRRQ